MDSALAKKVASPRGVFVGRGREIGELETGLEDAISGRGRLFLLVGEPGVGKTRLADEIVARAQARGVLTLWGRCWDGGDAPPYWPWTQIIRSYLAERDTEQLTKSLGPAARGVAQLVPELREQIPGDPGSSRASFDDTERARFQLFDGVARFFWRASREEPLVLVLDDLHVADAPSFLLLQFLARDLRGARLLIVGTYRDVEANRTPELSRVLGSLAREGRYLALRGLEEADVGAFIAEVAGKPPQQSVVRALYEATEGIPFFVDEMVRFLIAEGSLRRTGSELRAPHLGLPQGIRDAIRRRIETLSVGTKEVLSVASVIGREFGLKLLERVSGLGVDRLLEAMREAESYDIVEQGSMVLGHYSFSHVLVRDTFYYESPLARRIELHQTIGEVLEALHGEDRNSRLPNLAHHFFQAISKAGSEKALAYCVEAAKQDAKLRAYEEAAEHYKRALEALAFGPPADERIRCDLLLSLSESQWRAGDTASARSNLERAADLSRQLGDKEMLARAALGLATGPGEPHFACRADAALLDLLRDALEALGREDGALRARLLGRLAVALRFRGKGAAEERTGLSLEAVEMAERLDDPATRLAALYDRELSMLGPDGFEARTAAVDEILQLASELGDREMMFRGNHLRLLNCLATRDVHGIDGAIEACATLAEGLRQPTFDWQVGVARTVRAQLDGRFDDAESLAEAALETGERAHCEAAGHVFLAQRLGHSIVQDRMAELEGPLKRIAEEFPWLTEWRSSLAFLYAQLGRDPEARNEFERLAKDGFGDLPRDEGWYASIWFLSATCARLRDSKRAVALYELLLPSAGRDFVFGCASLSMGSVSSMLGLLAATAGMWGDGERHFENALRHDDVARQPFELLTFVQYAKALIRRNAPGDEERARTLNDRLVASAESLGTRAIRLQVERLAASIEPAFQKDRNVFQKAGDHWTISYEGAVFHLKDSIGLRYIAHLLRNAGKKIPAPEIVLCAEGVQAEAISAHDGIRDKGIAQLGLSQGFGDAGEVLDSQAEQAYRQRFAELEAALQEAKAYNDVGRVEAIIHEQDFLVRELSAGIGVGGRSRKAASFSERARLNVTRAIKAAIERIAIHSRPLADHLRKNIDTGKSCLYTTDSHAPTLWVF